MYSLNAIRDHFNCSRSFSHDQHHETDAVKRKGGNSGQTGSEYSFNVMGGRPRLPPRDLLYLRDPLIHLRRPVI